MSNNIFITKASEFQASLRVAVKDNIDVCGLPTTLGSRVIAESAVNATKDAVCVQHLRSAGARVVGKTNMVELALGAHGINPWFGTPRNPLDPMLAPGGSSSGSAVAVAQGLADIALGTDTGGSIRIPAACCGICGLKPSFGKLDLAGVAGLAPSMDTVGPLARDVDGIARACKALGLVLDELRDPPECVMLVMDGARPEVQLAIRKALSLSGFHIREPTVALRWAQAWRAGSLLLQYEAANVYQWLLPKCDELDFQVAARLRQGATVARAQVAYAQVLRRYWTATIEWMLRKTSSILITPTLPILIPSLCDARAHTLNWFTLPINIAGLPALAVPVPTEGNCPTSLQIIGKKDSESTLLAVARRLESSNGQGWLRV